MRDANKAKLTDAVVRRATLPDGRAERILWDTEVTGFGLRLRGDSKSYIVAYRPAGSGRGTPMKRVRIGTPETIRTASEARRIAFGLLGKAAAGGDPAKDRAETKLREKARVGALLDAYETDLERRAYVNRATVIATLRTRLAAHRGKDIRDLQGSDYAAIIRRLEAQGLQGAAQDFRSRCRTFLSWCVFEAKALDHNPLAGYRKSRGTRLERLARAQRGRALPDDELAAVWRASDPATVAGRYVRFLILTGCRRGEGAGLLYEMVDGDAGRIDLPATFTKQARGHVVFIAPALDELFGQCVRDARSDVVFPSWRTGGPMSGWTKLVEGLAEASGVGFTLHDLRRTFRTGLSRLGVDREIAELALGHAREDLEARYNRDDCEATLRRAFGMWAAHVLEAARKAPPETPLALAG